MMLVPLSNSPRFSTLTTTSAKRRSLSNNEPSNHYIDAEWEEVFEEHLQADDNETDTEHDACFSHADPIALYKKSKQLLLMRHHYYLNFYV